MKTMYYKAVQDLCSNDITAFDKIKNRRILYNLIYKYEQLENAYELACYDLSLTDSEGRSSDKIKDRYLRKAKNV